MHNSNKGYKQILIDTKNYNALKEMGKTGTHYIRVGVKESIKKIGLYCIACDAYYSTDSKTVY